MIARRGLARAGAAGGAHADETPEYWVTYSDLLVSLLVVFALLLFAALARVQQESKRADAARAGVLQLLAVSDSAMRVATESMGDGGSVKYDARTRTLTVRDEVLFPFGRADLRPEGRDLVGAVATRFIPRLLNDTTVAKHIEAIEVEGHTDTVGTYLSNLDLSQQRAQSVMRQLVVATYDMSSRDAEQVRSLLVASGRSEVEALRAAREGTYDDKKARRIVLRVRLRDEALLRRVLGR